jgi:PhnB protein
METRRRRPPYEPASKEEETMSPVKPVPDGFYTVTPYLVVRGAAKALDFYAKAFGAEERLRMPGPDGAVMHGEFKIGNSIIMIGEENPQMGALSPQAIGGTAVSLMLYVADVDAVFARATKAGCTAQMPPTDMFWGDRYGKLKDPFGHDWAIATHKEDVAPQEMAKRMAAMA